jgi:hypothetical protein
VLAHEVHRDREDPRRSFASDRSFRAAWAKERLATTSRASLPIEVTDRERINIGA